LIALGIERPAPPEPFGSYVEAVQTGNLLFLSGMLGTAQTPCTRGNPGRSETTRRSRVSNTTKCPSPRCAMKSRPVVVSRLW
jgi:enamine deaminase RidA (YjgF/YER057c/UK114 family)